MEEKEKYNKPTLPKVFKYILGLIFIVICLFLLCAFLLTRPKVQNWATSIATKKLSEKIDAKVSLDSISLDFRKGLKLWDLSVIENNGDTILSAKTINSSLKNNLTSLVYSRVDLDYIFIKDLNFNLRTDSISGKTNFDKIIEKFQPKDSTNINENSSAFELQLSKLELQNSKFNAYAQNSNLSINLQHAIIDIAAIDLKNNKFYLDNITLTKPEIRIHKKKIINAEQDSIINQKTQISNSSNTNRPTLSLNELHIVSGLFSIDTEGEEKSKEAINYNNFDAKEIQLDVSNFVIEDLENIDFNLDKFQGKLNDELEIEEMNCGGVHIHQKEIIFQKFVLKTNQSILKVESKLKFRSRSDFEDFNNRVFLDVAFDNAKFSLKEIAYLVPNLIESEVVQRNLYETIILDGVVKGRVNNFSTQNLQFRISNRLKFNGFFRARNITDPDKTTINVQVDSLRTSISHLEEIIPNFNLPANFKKLNNLSFTGRFDGFLYNFVAFGDLNTSLGRAKTDMQLNLSDGRDKAGYSGNLELVNFDLATWSENNDFGSVNFKTYVNNGVGLTLNTAKADLSGTLYSFTFKDYTYNDLTLEGKLEKNLFKGKLNINDPNVDLNFEGDFSFIDDKVVGDFEAKVDKLNLKELNLSKDSLNFSGGLTVSVKGSNLDDFEGDATFTDFLVSLNGKESEFDSIYIFSSPAINQQRLITVDSEELDVKLDGKINFNKLVPDLKSLIAAQHPAWAEYLKISKREVSDKQNFDFEIHVDDSKNLLAFLNLPDIFLTNLELEGNLNSEQELLNVNTKLDTLQFNKNAISNIGFSTNSTKEKTLIHLVGDSLYLNGKAREFLSIKTTIEEDTLLLNIVADHLLDTFANVDLICKAIPEEDKINLKMDQNLCHILGTDWNFDPENLIQIGHKEVHFSNFALQDETRSITIDSRGGKDFLVNILDLDFKLLNPIINYENIFFSGPLDVVLQVNDAFGNMSINGSINMDQLFLNGDPYGNVSAYLTQNLDENLLLDLDIINDSIQQKVMLDVLFDKEKFTLDGDLIAENFPTNFFEYIIKDGISDTKGSFDLNCEIRGKIPDIAFRGKGVMKDCGVKVDYIGNYLTFDNQEIRVNEKIIDVTGGIVNDKYGNVATLTGGITHEFFKDLKLNLSIDSDKFLMLETTKADNSSYFGTGIGSGNITFSGPFSQVDIVINATTGIGTVLNIPVESSDENYDESLIQFVDAGTLLDFNKDTLVREERLLSGTNVEINLSMTPEADVKIIFNEQLNDVIFGNGRGNIRMVIKRDGTFDVFGDYIVESGEYLFTALGIVAKPFKVKRGGTVTWTGDPINANLNIEAEYIGIDSPVNVFLAEYISEDNQNQYIEASQKTRVDLSLLIGGTLYNPDINFDINFPELQGEIRSFANNKMTILRQNPTDMNDQVAGLLLFGSFLPTNNPLGTSFVSGSNLLRTGYNTLSEFVSQQLSYLVSGLIEEALIEDGLLRGIDFEIGFSKNAEIVDGAFDNTGLAPDEIQVNFKPKFKNDRWSIDLGTNYVRESTIGINNYVFYNYTLEYALTQDRRLKLRVYGKNDFDEIIADREWKYGVGINFRREFGTLEKFKEAFKKDIKASINTDINPNKN